ncbi:hypothetical protein EDC56_0507 [Sinobacterium caligoides]|uniref:STAS domain-containing protein n=1 Tax=Sinobacterium caligoides TaxID=933926 RepID=A0A3N2DYT9_9GAMM|nr:STAS domain-containing protein [Sinobacterium caligoides]ROS04988.1 hypothetical protein EDC56_0507 [Sinobacterium caligoides]
MFKSILSSTRDGVSESVLYLTADECFDYHSLPELMRCRQLSVDGCVVDFSDTLRIDSAAIGGLMLLKRQIQCDGGYLRVVHCSKPIMRLLHGSGREGEARL